MKKIKEIISTNAIVLMVLGFIVLVILIIGLTFGWDIFIPQDKFTIYEQECYNLTNEEKCQLIFGEESVAISREEGGFNCYHNLKPGEYNESWWTPYFDTEEEINLSGKLCKKVEVDTIIIPKGYKCDVNLCSTGIAYTISKSDLTTEWLDENCEIARCTSCEDLECKNQKCDLYKCGNYIVEVNK